MHLRGGNHTLTADLVGFSLSPSWDCFVLGEEIRLQYPPSRGV